MLSITQSATQTKTITPNLLPCNIAHSGPVPIEQRYWSPSASSTSSDNDDKTQTSYFRGRKLAGRVTKVPDGYRGAVLQKSTDKTNAAPKRPTAEELRRLEEGDDDGFLMEQEEKVEAGVLEEKAGFDEMVIWGHEMMPEEDDVYVKGVREWVGFAEAMHSYEMPESGIAK